MRTGQPAQTYTLFVGVDIAATTAAVATQRAGAHASRSFTIAQTPEGYTKLGHQLQATGHVPSRILVVMEATGSYWISLATYLVRERFVVSVMNPAQAHHFAKALLKRAKTDAIDAQTLAQLAMVLQPEPWKPPPPIYYAFQYALQQRLAQRDDLLNLRQQVCNQLHAPAIRHKRVAPPRDRAYRQRPPTDCAFYMATLSAVQHNPVTKTFYARLRAGGKPEKVAR